MEYWILVLILALASVIAVVVAKRVAAHSFRCKHCGREFRLDWRKVPVTVHSDSEYMLACPGCGVKDWCTQLPISK